MTGRQQATGGNYLPAVERDELRRLVIETVDLLGQRHALLFDKDNDPQRHSLVKLILAVSNYNADRHFATSA